MAKALAVPLCTAGKALGVLYAVYFKPRPELSPEELDFAAGLANQCAIAIHKTRLLEEARTQRARLESIIEQMPDGIIIAAAPQGRIVLVNRRAREITGRALKVGQEVGALAEAVGICHPDGRSYRGDELVLYRALTQGVVTLGEEQMVRRADGKTIAVLASAAPLRDETGQIREAVLVCQDMTPLKEAQRRLEETAQLAHRQKAEMDAIIETLAEGVMIADVEGNILRSNRASASILGFESPEQVYRHIEEYSAFDVRDAQGRPLPWENWPLARAMRGESFTEQEVIITGADARRRNLLAGGSCVCGQRGEVLLAIIVFRDITNIRLFERQREEFISVIAHDLRSALTIVRANVQLLLHPSLREAMPQMALKPLESINSSTNRLEKMISDLLDASRIEARRLKLEKRPVDLEALVRSVTERSAELTKGHAVQIVVKGPVPTIQADPDRLEQILTNLLTNAAKYSYPGSRITVEVGAGEGEVMVSVTNLGKGVKPDEAHQLFTRFHRTAAAEQGKEPGLGLGLYIARGLVEAHGGRIWVESEPDKYATFRFALLTSESIKRGRGVRRPRPISIPSETRTTCIRLPP